MVFLNEKIDKNTPVPMYFQLKNIILKAIKEERLYPGDAIPTEIEFSEMFQISRTTIRQAIMELVMEGYLYREKSKGTFVAKPKVTQSFVNRIKATHILLKDQVMIPVTKVLEINVVKVKKSIAQILEIKENDDVIKMMRLRYVDNDPILISESYFPLICSGMLKVDMEKCGIFEFLERDDKTKAVRSVRSLTAILATKADAIILDSEKGAAIQLTKSLSYNKDDVPVEYTITKFRGDRNEFVVELKV